MSSPLSPTAIWDQDYSPFDCLGLQTRYDDDGHPQLYSNTELVKARKRAVLHCHPDKRTYHNIDTRRWPELCHIESAYEYLCHFQDVAWEVFDDYPRTFFPEHAIGSPDVYNTRSLTETSLFCACTECQMVLLKMSEPLHMADEHGLLRHCNRCNLYTSETAWQFVCPVCCELDHAQTHRNLHPNPDCCYEQTIETLDGHHHAICGLCNGFLHPDGLPFHLADVHLWRQCPACQPQGETFIHHVSCHAWVSCPFCKVAFDGPSLKPHVLIAHHLKLCQDCLGEPDGFLQHLQLEHPGEPCTQPGCSILIPRGDIDLHLIRTHQFSRCPYCNKVSRDIQGHINDHQLQDCRICHESHPKAALLEHLVKQHSWIQCPFCESLVESLPQLQEHLGLRQCSSYEQLSHSHSHQHREAASESRTTKTPESTECRPATTGDHSNRQLPADEVSAPAVTDPDLPGRLGQGARRPRAVKEFRNAFPADEVTKCDGCNLTDKRETIAAHLFAAHT